MSMKTEHDWLVNQADIESKYAGEYIAVSGQTVVSHGKDFDAVLDEGRKSGEEPLIYKVPPMPDDSLMIV